MQAPLSQARDQAPASAPAHPPAGTPTHPQMRTEAQPQAQTQPHPYPTPAGVAERPRSPLPLAAQHAVQGLASRVHIPETSVFEHLAVAARRYPGKTAIQFFDAATSYAQLLTDVERMAGHLQAHGVWRGDRVLVVSQNCPQFIVAYLAILRADACFVPVNAMLLADEIRHIVQDSGAVAAFVGQELLANVAPLLGSSGLQHLVVHAYGDALAVSASEVQNDGGGIAIPASMPSDIPDWVRETSSTAALPAGAVRWAAAMASAPAPRPHLAGPDDWCMLPYTSGTTGAPKACVHTHRTVTTSFAGAVQWRRVHAEAVFLSVAPLFHLLGLQGNVNAALYVGGTIVLMPRWDRALAADMIEQHRVTNWSALPAMLVDFFDQPGIGERDLSSLQTLNGGGAAMPEQLANLLKTRHGLDYIEGYGLTETASFLCVNPLHKPKRSCLGVATFGVDLRIIDPDTLQAVAPGEQGEIVVHAAQVMLGYWNQPEANAQTFLVIDGKRFFRTGDLASVDDEGYVFMRDRLKRMINASGYKVWPAEVEAMLHTHPAVLEACVIAVPDDKRGESVKAIIALRSGAGETEDDLLAWCKANMATYKAPRQVAIEASLPKGPTGKIAWREMQEREWAQAQDAVTP